MDKKNSYLNLEIILIHFEMKIFNRNFREVKKNENSYRTHM